MSQTAPVRRFQAPVWTLILIGFLGLFGLYSAYSQWTTGVSSVLAGTRTFSQSALIIYALATRSKAALISAFLVRAVTEIGDLVTLSLVFKPFQAPFVGFVAVILVLEIIAIVVLMRQPETSAA